jgi:hypothetical protein
MKRKTTQVVTIETYKVTVVRPSGGSINAWCEFCGAEVEMVTPEKAAAIIGVPAREIYRGIENGSIHFLEANDGTVLICTRTDNSQRACPSRASE